MRRRDFIAGLGGAVIWSPSARAEQSRSVRKLGVLVNFLSDEPEGQARTRAFTNALAQLGWVEGQNLRTEIRYAGDDEDRHHQGNGLLGHHHELHPAFDCRHVAELASEW